MASIGDGMTQGLKDAIKAKHKLVEQMKEEVAHPEDHKQNNLLWKIIIVCSSILLLFLAVHQVRWWCQKLKKKKSLTAVRVYMSPSRAARGTSRTNTQLCARARVGRWAREHVAIPRSNRKRAIRLMPPPTERRGSPTPA